MKAGDRAVRGLVALLGCTGLGVLLWMAVAPDESRRKEMAKEHPKSSPQQQLERQQQNTLVMAAIKQAAETKENVAQREWPWSK